MKKTKKTKTFNQIWIRDPCNHRGVLSGVPLVVCSCSSGVAANIVCTLPSWCTRALYGNQNGITWLWRTIRANQWDNVERQKNKIRIKSQIMLLVTFIPALPKMSPCVFYVCLFSSVVLLFMQACDDCLLSVYRMYRGGRTWMPFFSFFRTLTDF